MDCIDAGQEESPSFLSEVWVLGSCLFQRHFWSWNNSITYRYKLRGEREWLVHMLVTIRVIARGVPLTGDLQAILQLVPIIRKQK